MSVDADATGTAHGAAGVRSEAIAEGPQRATMPAQRTSWGDVEAAPDHAAVGGDQIALTSPVAALPFPQPYQDAADRLASAFDVFSLPARSRRAAGFRAWTRHLEVVVGAATGLGVAVAVGAAPVALLAVLAWLLLAYSRVPTRGGPVVRQLQPLALGAVLVMAATAVLGTTGAVSAATDHGVVWAVLAALAAASAVRVTSLRLAGPARLVVIGDLMEATRWVDHWRHRRDVKVVGAVIVEPDTDDSRLPGDLFGVPTASSLESAHVSVAAWAGDLVAFAPSPGLTPASVRRAAWSLHRAGVGVSVVGLFDAVAPHRIRPGVVGGETLCEVEAPGGSAIVSALKQLLDRAAAALLLVLCAPLLALLVVLVRLDTPGPALFRQTRIGLDGRPFTVFKLRTMRRDAEKLKDGLLDANEHDGVLFKMRHDPRITRVGYYLRRSSLDELPQLINVVRGEMSLIGPRPHLPREIANMGPDALHRLAVKPGITGLWQVSGRADLDWDESVALDSYYVDNWTLGGDAHILLRTVDAVLRRRGAY